MQTFVRIVEANSFTRAAESLDLQRTTRRLSLTPEGERYYGHCCAILAAIDDAEGDFLGEHAGHMQGRLRIDLPGALGRAIVLPRSGEFAKRIRRST